MGTSSPTLQAMPSLKRLGTSYFKKLESVELSANLCPPGSRLAAAIYSLLPAGASLPARPRRDSGRGSHWKRVCIPRRRHEGATDAHERSTQTTGAAGHASLLALYSSPPCPGPGVPAAGSPVLLLQWIRRTAGARTRSARGAQRGAGVAGGCGRAEGRRCLLSRRGPGKGRAGAWPARGGGRGGAAGPVGGGEGVAGGGAAAWGAPSAARTVAVGMAAGAERPDPGAGRSWEGAPHE